MKNATTFAVIFLMFFIVISCKSTKKEAEKPYSLTTQVTVSGEKHAVDWYVNFQYNKPIHPYKAAMKIDGKDFELNTYLIDYLSSGYELLRISYKTNVEIPNDYEDDYWSAPPGFDKEKNKVDLDNYNKLIDSFYSAIANAKSVTIDLKGKTGNGTYIISQEDIAKFKKVYEWTKEY